MSQTKQRVVAFPYFYKNNVLHIVLITNKKGNHWILPKGHTERAFKKSSVALIESFEEAGVRGFLGSEEITYTITNKKKAITYICYPIIIDTLLSEWEESSLRKRVVLPLDKALKKVSSKTNKAIITYFGNALTSPSSFKSNLL